MSDYCPACDNYVALIDPHLDCTGPKWVTGQAIPGFDRSKVVLHGLEPDVLEVTSKLERVEELEKRLQDLLDLVEKQPLYTTLDQYKVDLARKALNKEPIPYQEGPWSACTHYKDSKLQSCCACWDWIK